MLCSWISPDSLDYLDPETIGGIDLYCYCYNNPVMYVDPSGHLVISTLIIGALIGAAVSFGTSIISQTLTGDKQVNWGQVALDTLIGGISGALGVSGISKVMSTIVGGVLGAASSIGGDLIVSNGDWEQVNVWKAIAMGGIGALLGSWTGAGTQNTRTMVSAINSGKSWGSKAFLMSAKEVALKPDSRLALATMYMFMANAINLYTVQGIVKVSTSILGSTFLGNLIGW